MRQAAQTEKSEVKVKKGVDMASALWYTKTSDGESMNKMADQVMQGINKRRAAHQPKRAYNKDTQMTPSNGTRTAPTQKTVFDLAAFDDVKLVKQVELPQPVTSVQEALAALGNDSEALLAVINAGLDERAVEAARKSADGWQVENEDGETSDYTGKFADEKTGKLINGAVLSMAKVLGYDKSLPKDKKRELKEQAIGFIRQNPAMLQSIQGTPEAGK